MATPAAQLRVRTRQRKDSLKIDQAAIYNRVYRFYEDDLSDRDWDREVRLQRYAKYRMWVEGKDWPWDNAADIPLSDMMEKSLRAQDSIHNAVMSNRPTINATAYAPDKRDKEQTIDHLIDYQVFEEQSGEEMVGQAADAFVNDGVLTIFVPWVREEREMSDVRLFDPIPEAMDPTDYFRQILTKSFTDGAVTMMSNGWDWKISRQDAEGRNETVEVKFYTKPDGDVEMVVRERVVRFNGPKPIVMDYDDVLHPVRSENLQIPGPSNPGGAAHVILIDHPTVDEIRRLRRNGYYDLMEAPPADGTDELEALNPSPERRDEEEQKDTIAGRHDSGPQKDAKSHNHVTRLVCFDCYDVDGDGIDEDVIFWVILELKQKVVKAAYLNEIYPCKVPRRPFGEASYLPVRGRRVGISQLEILEGLHDVMKTIMDQSVDSGTLSNTPFGFYRASANVRPEVIRLQPGELYPVPNPQQDINFPRIGNPQAQGFAINMLTMLGQMQERAVVIGDLQLGRVPAGRASAMRTTSNMSMLMGQGEARPERIMRRFFIALTQVWTIIHELNQYFLPKDKQYRISAYQRPDEDVYRKIKTRDEIRGRFDFGFKPAILNTSKEQLRQGLQMMMASFVNQLAFQMGIMDGERFYTLARDFSRAWGMDPDKYLRPPSKHAAKVKILTEEAIRSIMNSQMPDGYPAELGGPREHLQKLIEFMQSDNFGLLKPEQIDLFRKYIEIVRRYVAEQVQQERMQQALAAFQQAMTGGGEGGRPPESAPEEGGNPNVASGNELIDESLPGAGGGGGP